MATEQASTVPTDSVSAAKWTSWLAALIGLWVIVSPFVLSGSVASGNAMWSNVIAGVLVVIFAAYGAYKLRNSETAGTGAEGSGWIAGLIGLWILVTPFVLTGAVASSPVMWSNVVAGVIVAVLAAYAGYELE